VFSGISTDSRTSCEDRIFVAIRGESHDGHRFANQAAANGCRGVIVEQKRIMELPLEKWGNLVCIGVPDTLRALGDLARFRRNQTDVRVVAITGSNGKTSTKQMTAGIFSRCFNTLSTLGNFNNEIGLPLTLFGLNSSHQWAVLELGMNHPGEIARLTDICCPDIGIITNIGPAHLEGLGSVEGVMAAKGELLKEMPPESTIVLNADDSRCLSLAKNAKGPVVLFGFSEKARIRAGNVVKREQDIEFILQSPDEEVFIRLNVPALFMVSNALAAAAAAMSVGIPVAEIARGLEDFRPVKGRMTLFETTLGFHILDDTYNANPDSMKVAIAALMEMKTKGRTFLALGDMRELGNYSKSLHKDLGRICADSDPELLCITGEHSSAVAQGALETGLSPRRIFIGDRAGIIACLKEKLMPGDRILVKGSRAMGMEMIADSLKEWGNQTVVKQVEE
jgi:UDP-N-acetylmuramoyl-tripeptide--D-alanyl-D-alanine ligase